MSNGYRIGRWEVKPSDRTIRSGDMFATLSPRAMDVLVELAAHAGEVVSGAHLIQTFWPRTVTSPNALQKVVTELRHALQNGESETYIETVPKRGYRLVAPVTVLEIANGNGSPTRGDDRPPAAATVDLGTPGARDSRRQLFIPRTIAARVVPVSAIVFAAVAFAYTRVQSLDAETIEIGGRSAVLLPASETLPPDDAQTLETIRGKVIERFVSSGATLRSTRSIEWDRDSRYLPDHWHADYVVRVDLTDTDGRLQAILSIAPAAADDYSRHEQFAGSTANRRGLVDAVAEHASSDLAVLLDKSQVANMHAWRTGNVDAFRYAREAELFQQRPVLESQKRAAVLFRRALAEDPKFGRAYLGLAFVYSQLAYFAVDTAEHAHQRENLQALLRDASQAQIDLTAREQIERLYRSASVSNAYDAERYWHEELRRNPRDIAALVGYSELLGGAKLLDESQRYFEIALQQPLPRGYEQLHIKYSRLAEARGDFDSALRLQKEYASARPDDTLTLYAIVRNLAVQRRFEEAEMYVARLERGDAAWGFAARSWLLALRGDLPRGSAALRANFENPLASNAGRSAVCFAVGDVECGVRYRRQIEWTFLRLAWIFEPGEEMHWPRAVVDDPRYQALLEDLGIGRSWRAYMRQSAQALAAVTGVSVTTPPPPEDLHS